MNSRNSFVLNALGCLYPMKFRLGGHPLGTRKRPQSAKEARDGAFSRPECIFLRNVNTESDESESAFTIIGIGNARQV